MVLPPVIYQR